MRIVNKQSKKKVLALALFAGELMLINGAETYRVEDTIRRICESRGLDNITAFVTPTVIIIGDDRDDGYSFVKRIDKRTTNFEIITLVNSLSREFVEGKKNIMQMNIELKAATDKTTYSEFTRIFWCAFASSMFAYLFGGDGSDMLCGFLISALATKIDITLSDWDVNLFLLNVICSTLIAVLAYFAYNLSFGSNLDMIIAASIMPQLPGLSLTNGIRDFIAGDLISGVSRAFEALLIAIAIAVSIGSVLAVIAKMEGLV